MNGLNGLNGLDYVGIVLFAVGAIYGLQRGALRMVTSVVALAAGVYFASLYYTRAGSFVETQFRSSHALGAVIGYVAIFALIFTVVEIVGSSAIRLMQIVHLSPLDRLAGGLLGAGIAAVVAGLAVMLMAAVLPPDAAILRNSQLVPMLLAYNEMLVGYIPGDARLAYERNRDDLMRYWVENAMKGANSAPSPAAPPPDELPSPATK
jgi:membrane protein required for colicin V production